MVPDVRRKKIEKRLKLGFFVFLGTQSRAKGKKKNNTKDAYTHKLQWKRPSGDTAIGLQSWRRARDIYKDVFKSSAET